jgi:predicted nucleic acid-binding protein
LNLNGLGNSITGTEKLTSRIETFFIVLPDSMEAFRIWRRLIVEHEVKGAKVHDARLVAIMQAHGIKRILTFNTSDFKRFSDLVAVHPTELAP